ncbi:type VII secretion integral membrane protein EccD [Mycolicibacterium sp. S2-37]|uniref:type VII secretion integral membrane protein EccD n=1 Tax=Mycolicibacterium sp. S2-37 TaxID=2810297 RepID=UPI001A942454|nr:type VII secretion integral membrane protein EccD [Mycolicibacterium sp. S2-37]MBO0681248.1 type VII secretion integral membrane protein EccD [Mycolicibacterium sp. S2-37]
MSDNTVMPIVRVAVLAAGDDGGRLTEMALPADLPLREILPAVQRMAHPHDDSDSTDAARPPRRLSLAPIGGAPFSLDATLDTVGVVDGDLLALQPVPAGPAAPRIVEDIADAAVIFSAAQETRWGPRHIQRAAAAAALTLILVATALGVTHRIVTGELIGLFVVSAVAVAAVLGSLLAVAGSPRLSTALGIAALPPVAAAFALAVPGDFGAAQVLLAAAGVAAWSVISLTVGERAVALFTATAAAGFGVLVAAAAASVWTLSGTVLGCVLILIGLLITVQAAQLSAMWARFPLPAIPAPGDPTPSAQPLRVLEDLPRRVRISQSHQTGFLAAGMLLSVTGSLTLIGTQSASPWAWYVVVAAAAGATLRARVWDSAPCKAWLLAHPFVLTVGLLVLFAATDRFGAAWWALLALVVLAGAWIVVALNPSIAAPDTYSLPARRLVGFAASAIDASLIPVMAFLVGLFSLVLNR